MFGGSFLRSIFIDLHNLVIPRDCGCFLSGPFCHFVRYGKTSKTDILEGTEFHLTAFYKCIKIVYGNTA